MPIQFATTTTTTTTTTRYWYRTLVQTYTYLQLTQIGSMPSTKNMKALKAWYVRCGLTKVARWKGIYTLEDGVQLSHIPMHYIGAECADPLGTTAVQNTLGTHRNTPYAFYGWNFQPKMFYASNTYVPKNTGGMLPSVQSPLHHCTISQASS